MGYEILRVDPVNAHLNPLLVLESTVCGNPHLITGRVLLRFYLREGPGPHSIRYTADIRHAPATSQLKVEFAVMCMN